MQFADKLYFGSRYLKLHSKQFLFIFGQFLPRNDHFAYFYFASQRLFSNIHYADLLYMWYLLMQGKRSKLLYSGSPPGHTFASEVD